MSRLFTVYDDKEALNNVIDVLTMDVEEVFYVYHHDVSRHKFNDIRKVLKKHGKDQVHFLNLKNDLKQIQALSAKYPDLIIDVGGGKYLSLFLFEKFLDTENQIIYYDNEENVVKDYRTHTIIHEDVYKLSIEDVLKLRGATIKESMHKSYTDKRTKEALIATVDENMDDYASFIRYISKLNSLLTKNSYKGNRTYILSSEAISKIKTDKCFRKSTHLFTITDNKLTFKTEGLRQMVFISGAFLENYLYVKLKDSKKFDDVMMSVVIDFSENKYKHPVNCEIDVLVLKDNKLLFISCKSSKIDTPDLNEIYVHDNVFGNVLSRPVLCVGEEINEKYPSVYAKSQQLDVYVMDKSSFKNGIVETVESIYNNTYRYDRL